MRMTSSRFALLLYSMAAAPGCGGSSSTDGGNTQVPADMATASDLSMPAGNTMNGCGPDDYVDQTMGSDSDRMIMTTNAGTFDYPCMTILAGQAVEFMWRFATYPLEPGLAPSHAGDKAGTEPTPIASHKTGSLYTVTFPNPGFYPFYVPGHDGLVGVVQVLAQGK